MKIDTCKLKIALCPMAGITDSAFRIMNVLGGTDIVYSEMAHVNAISHGNKKTLSILKASPLEFPYIVQLFGNDPKYFAEATKIISKRGVPVMRYKPFSKKQIDFIKEIVPSGQFPVSSLNNFIKKFLEFQEKLSSKNWVLGTGYLIPSGLDINLGCPARKVCGHGSGAALWTNLPKIRNILKAVLSNTKQPVSIKVRSAVGDTTVLDLLESIKDLPIKRVMIHGRSYKQGFSGEIDTEIIKQAIKKYPQFEFWVNGGIVDQKSALDIAKKTGCNKLGIARGTYGNPLLAEEIKISSQLSVPSSQSNTVSNLQSTRHWALGTYCILAYIHSILNYQSKDRHGIIEMRKHLCWYFKDFPGAKEWRKRLVTVNNLSEIKELLNKIL